MKKPKEPEKPLELAVQELADMTSENIAKLMQRRKVHGRPCTVTKCPLANLMHNVYGGQFIVGPKFIMRRRGGATNQSYEKVKTPEGLMQFIQAFDLGRYPSLIEPPPRAFGKRKKVVRPSGRKHVVRNHPALEVGR